MGWRIRGNFLDTVLGAGDGYGHSLLSMFGAVTVAVVGDCENSKSRSEESDEFDGNHCDYVLLSDRDTVFSNF